MTARKKVQSTLKSQNPIKEAVQAQAVRPEPLKVLMEWRAPVRVFKKRNREYFTTLGAIAFLVIVILLLLQEWVLIMVIVALMFVTYIMGTVPPQEIDHKITNRGIKVGEANYHWSVLGRFWFKEEWGQKIVQVETLLSFPQRLIMLLGENKPEKVAEILSEYLLHEEPEKTWVDKTSEWISRRVPLETN